MPRLSKISVEDRMELVTLKRDGRLEEMKARALQLGVSAYYGTILESRERNPYQRRRWARARAIGPVIA